MFKLESSLCNQQGRRRKKMTKSLPITQEMVMNSYLKVDAKNGGAGIDKQSIEMFNKDLSSNLYKIWNRMTSGSYFPPPVRTVLIPKKQGGIRPLGIPTVSDRIAQGVVKDYIEPTLEATFHNSSYGYRPDRSAHDALSQCQDNCIRYAWVIDVDIKGFFDNINHDVTKQLLQKHIHENWVLMYIDRWLNAGVEQDDGTIVARTKGTPQGGVISPVLANLYLHHAFDTWMDENNSQCPFERYADDIVIHCRTKAEAEQLMFKIAKRMEEYSLTLHSEKTKIVYCKNYLRTEQHVNESFTFLGYSYQPRRKRDRFARGNKSYMIFAPAISNNAKTSIRKALKASLNTRNINMTLKGFATILNPKIRGWVNYYTRFYRELTLEIFHYLNTLIRKWIRNKYRTKRRPKMFEKYRAIQKAEPTLFYHWRLGIIE
ncbi:group II intron reverse transcriptase/maturase [Chitinophagaceae bacterium 26-R-25]|nr:group II intron reverse transcriptase/maturase [Chitinophagaceae bacterium 26-R-25]